MNINNSSSQKTRISLANNFKRNGQKKQKLFGSLIHIGKGRHQPSESKDIFSSDLYSNRLIHWSWKTLYHLGTLLGEQSTSTYMQKLDTPLENDFFMWLIQGINAIFDERFNTTGICKSHTFFRCELSPTEF